MTAGEQSDVQRCSCPKKAQAGASLTSLSFEIFNCVYKRIIQIAFILAGLGVVAYVYFKFSGEEKDFVDSADALPSNCSLIVELSSFENANDYHSLLKEISGYTNELAGVSFNPVHEWPSIIHTMDSLRSVSTEWNSILNKSHVLFGCGDQSRADAWIMSLGLRAGSDEAFVKNLMTPWLSDSEIRDFKKTKIHDCRNLHYAEVNNCLVITSTGSLMEDVIIRAEKKDLLRKDEYFMASRELVATDIPIHFYFNTEHGDWMQLDPTFVTSDVAAVSDMVLSGYCLLSDSTKNSFSLAQTGHECHIQNILPSRTSIVDVFNYTDFETGWRKQEEFFEGTTATKFWSQAWQDFGDTCQCDVNESMLSWRSGEWGTAVISLSDSSTAEVSFFGIRDSLDAIQLMKPVLTEQSDGLNRIHKLRYPELFERNQNQALLIESNYIKKIGEYLFTAATPAELLAVTADTNQLVDSPKFKHATKTGSKNPGRFIFQTEYYTSPLPKLLLNIFGGSDYLSTSIEHFKENKYLVMVHTSFTKKNDTKETQVADSPTHSSEVEKVEILHGPWTVTNHNTQEKESVFQNLQKEICLQDKSGKILWKKQLESDVFGEVYQIDALKNGKLQLAFTTQTGLHLIDRNGNELKGFPVLPKPSITAPLHIADYDNNKKYRLLFAVGDGMVLNYTVQGTITEGWKHEQHFVVTCIDHFKIDKDDYVMTVSPTGQLEFLKRTGEIRQKSGTVLSDYNGKNCKVIAGASLAETQISYTTKNGDSKTVKLEK